MSRLIAAVLAALLIPTAHAALSVGAPAPDFTADAAVGGQAFKFRLADALKKGPVVLYFYPKAFTSGCTVEAHLFAEATPVRGKKGPVSSPPSARAAAPAPQAATPPLRRRTG